ncbi:MAG: hypothetical protein NZ480_06270 [Bdellovibrionaceae bacterium]|nr:hypothetical protein [Pseudobdellovibrionaceae bacterium]MDW8189353.1 hypothetical protein [Pseudobdellovibrionaceae bacterium]
MRNLVIIAVGCLGLVLFSSSLVTGKNRIETECTYEFDRFVESVISEGVYQITCMTSDRRRAFHLQNLGDRDRKKRFIFTVERNGVLDYELSDILECKIIEEIDCSKKSDDCFINPVKQVRFAVSDHKNTCEKIKKLGMF